MISLSLALQPSVTTRDCHCRLESSWLVMREPKRHGLQKAIKRLFAEGQATATRWPATTHRSLYNSRPLRLTVHAPVFMRIVSTPVPSSRHYPTGYQRKHPE